MHSWFMNIIIQIRYLQLRVSVLLGIRNGPVEGTRTYYRIGGKHKNFIEIFFVKKNWVKVQQSTCDKMDPINNPNPIN